MPTRDTSPYPLVRRVWKRDGSASIIPLEMAVESIMHNTGMSRQQVKEELLAGRTIETPLATFRVVDYEAGIS